MHYVEVKGILSAHNGMNLYRGCTHGCIYCDSRSKCYHIDHAFEDIEVKANAIELLEAALKRKRKKCMLGMGSMTDPYIPLEEEIGNVRRALALASRYGFGVTLTTKSNRMCAPRRSVCMCCGNCKRQAFPRSSGFVPFFLLSMIRKKTYRESCAAVRKRASAA